MADSDSSRVQIWVAIIGLVSAVCVAVIANWDKIFPPKPSSSVSASANSSARPKDKSHVTVSGNANHDSDKKPDALSQDSARIIAAISDQPRPLPRGRKIDFQVRVEYDLSSLESASLIASAVEFPLDAGGCNGSAQGRIVADDEARLHVDRGRKEVVMSVPWYGDNPTLSPNPKLHNMKGLGAGYLGFRADLLSDDQKFYRSGKISQTCFRFE